MRLIDADALLEVLRVREDEWNTPDETWRPEREYGNAIKNAPTIDAVPKTQCLDCQFSGKYSGIDLRKINATG